MNPSEFREIVSGERRGVGASLIRGLLRCAEVPYRAAVGWRNRRYDRGQAEIQRVGVPVVCVGNLTLGGTGKTPMVEWLARWFRQRGVRVCIVSRGYRSGEDGANDEALELEQKLPDVPHVQNPDRVAAAQMAIEEFESQLILLDDGFQHRRLARDLDIVLLDALEPFGFEHVFPRGTLREPLAALGRAQAVVLSRAEVVGEAEREEIRRRALEYAPGAVWAEATHAPAGLVSASGRESPLEELRDRRVAAFCGLGNPAGFKHTLAACGCRVVEFREFPDHHAYPREDVESLARWADGLDVEMAVCTQKDLVKLDVERLGRRPLRAVAIRLEFLRGEEELEAKLLPLLSGEDD